MQLMTPQNVTVNDFDDMTVSELRVWAKSHGLKQMSKDKAELIARCKDAFTTHKTAQNSARMPTGTVSAQTPEHLPAPTTSTITIKGHDYADLGNTLTSIGTPPEGLLNQYPVLGVNGQRIAHLGGTEWLPIAEAAPAPQPQAVVPVPEPLALVASTPAPEPNTQPSLLAALTAGVTKSQVPEGSVTYYLTPPERAFPTQGKSKQFFFRLQWNSQWGINVRRDTLDKNNQLVFERSQAVRFGDGKEGVERLGQFHAWLAQEIQHLAAIAPK